MIAALSSGQSFLEYVVHSLFLGPLQIPASGVDLSPLSILQGFEYAIAEGGFEGDLRAACWEWY